MSDVAPNPWDLSADSRRPVETSSNENMNYDFLQHRFGAKNRSQAIALAEFLRLSGSILAKRDIRTLVDMTQQGHEWQPGDVPGDIPAAQREAAADLLNMIAARFRKSVEQRDQRLQRIEEARNQISAQDRRRLSSLHGDRSSRRYLRHEDLVQARLETFQAIDKWLAMPPVERLAWFERVETQVRQRLAAARDEAEQQRAPEQGKHADRQRVRACNTLAIDLNATAQDVKRAYREAAKHHHPDAGGDPKRFKIIQQAYELLRRT